MSAIQGVATGTSYVESDDSRDFDGVNDHITWAAPVDLSGGPVSFAAFVRLDTEAANAFIFNARGTASGPNSLTLEINTGPLRLAMVHQASGVDCVRRTVVPTLTTAEHHVAFTYDGLGLFAGVTVYLDGIPAAAYSNESDFTGALEALDLDIVLGGRPTGGSNMDGRMRDARMWNRVLTDAEIRTVFQGGKRFIGFKETFPKAFQLTLEGLTTTEETVFREFLRVARPATYNGTVLVVPDPHFGYDDSTGAAVVDVEGFDNASAPPSFGGPYAHLFVL